MYCAPRIVRTSHLAIENFGNEWKMFNNTENVVRIEQCIAGTTWTGLARVRTIVLPVVRIFQWFPKGKQLTIWLETHVVAYNTIYNGNE